QVADQVNAIFAPAGSRVDIQRRATGLEGIDIAGPAGGTDTGSAGREGEEGGTITFPWQQGRQGEDETPASPLIGKIRVVPIHRQNAVMILAAPEYRDAVRDIIVDDLDKPGRQVMIAAIIAEVELTDELALGLRWGTNIAPPLGDNSFGASGNFLGEADDILSSFFNVNQGLLTVNADLNLVLDALAQKTKIRVLQEPVVFTSDNQEARFFQGQDVPIQQATQGNQGFVSQSFDYQAVGIGLNARPRITTHGDVDMEINLVISNINIAATAASGADAPFFDRRETTTQVIVQDGQTIVISGILRDQESQVKRKFPLLGDIPLVGALFTSVDNETTRTELLAFVTPYVVETPGENDSNFNERARQRLEDLSKPLKEQEADDKDLPDRIRRRLLQPQIDKGRIPADALDEINEG
ncbi:MAG: type II secretion system protein GspD, partial [Planctomycetota bacterium]